MSTVARNFYGLVISEAIFRFTPESARLNVLIVHLHLQRRLQCIITVRPYITGRGRRPRLTEDESNFRRRQNNKLNFQAPRKQDIVMRIFFSFYRRIFNGIFWIRCAFCFVLLFRTFCSEYKSQIIYSGESKHRNN